MTELSKERWDTWYRFGKEHAEYGIGVPPHDAGRLEAWNAGIADYTIRTANGKPVDQPNSGVPEREQNDPNAGMYADLTPSGSVADEKDAIRQALVDITRKIETDLGDLPIVTENPKDAVGSAKVSFACIPAAVVAELGVAMMEGARKYGRHNYRAAKIKASIYYDAVLRHMTAWFEGEDTDPDSGISHVTKAIASLAVLRDGQVNGNLIDDRPPPAKAEWMAELNGRAAALAEKYPNPKKAVTRND